VQADLQKREITMMRIVLHDDRHYYSLDNRRLAVFRMLEIVGKTRIVKAQVVPKSDSEWNQKFRTPNQGLVVRIRGTEYIVGHDLASITFPLDCITRRTKVRRTMELPDMDSDSESDDNDMEAGPQQMHQAPGARSCYPPSGPFPGRSWDFYSEILGWDTSAGYDDGDFSAEAMLARLG